MRDATRLSRICFISLISPRKKLDVFLSFGTIISYLIAFERLFLISLCSNDYCLSRHYASNDYCLSRFDTKKEEFR